MKMSHVITLSSDEESAPEPPRKKIKPTFLSSAIRITKVTTITELASEKEKKNQSLSDIIASSRIGSSISITPVTINNNSVKLGNGTVIKKPVSTKSSNAKNCDNIVVLSDDEEVVEDNKTSISEISPSPIPENESETIIDRTSNAKDCESDDDCMIVDRLADTSVDKTNTGQLSHVLKSNLDSSAFEIIDLPQASDIPKASASIIKEPNANAFAIEDLPPATPKSNLFEIVELTETEDVLPIAEKEIEVRLVPCDKIKTKQNNSIAESVLENECADSENGKSKAILPDTIELDSLSKQAADTTTEQELTETSSSLDNEECASNKENSVDEDVSTSATSVEHSRTPLLEKYIEVCLNTVRGTQFENVILKKLESLRGNYKKCGAEEGSSQFKKMLEDNITRAEKSVAMAAMSFKEVYQLVKDLGELGVIEVTIQEKRNLKKLEKTLKLLSKKIKKLEQAEVDFDQEEDSKFLQLARYNDRFVKVHKKYCSLLKKNPYSGRLTHSKLDFVDSEYIDINRAISKKFKDNSKFPSFMEMQNLIKKVAEEHKLNFSETKLKSESVHCFKKLGELLQSRRKKELYEDHYLTIGDTEDPATKDAALNAKLILSRKLGVKKIDDICEKFTNKQERGLEADVSDGDGSDKSDYVDSD